MKENQAETLSKIGIGLTEENEAINKGDIAMLEEVVTRKQPKYA